MTLTMSPIWTLVIPVKGTSRAKSRLGASADQALAIALDTIDVARRVAPVIVIGHSSVADPVRELGATFLHDPGSGLNAAVDVGCAHLSHSPAAVLLGDLPALTESELERALVLSASTPRAIIADREGTGTVLLTALRGAAHRPRFGTGSARRHRDAGYRLIEPDDVPGLRSDVDTREDLARIASRVGFRTSLAFRLDQRPSAIGSGPRAI